jgi:hypothetical protein
MRAWLRLGLSLASRRAKPHDATKILEIAGWWLVLGVSRETAGTGRIRAAHRRGGAAMESKGSQQAQRFNASHVVEAELEHLDWATRQPVVRMLNTGYWRRRVLAIKCRYELTHQQGLRIEQILQRLGDPVD